MPTIRSYNKRLEALKSERSSFIPLYTELSDYHLANRGRFLTSDRNKGHKRNTKQINNSSRLSSRTLSSGMMSGITSPARPWFRISTGDAKLDDVAAVKEWLFEVQTIMYKVFSASNMYNSLHQVYAELGVFGTACMGVYQDFDDVIWCKTYTVGSYLIGVNGQNISDTMYREYELSVAQIEKQFGLENASQEVKKQWESGNTEAWVKVVHVIEPNDDRDNSSAMSGDKAFRSVYYEATSKGGQSEDKFLRMSGFDEFPILTPRWDVVGEDVYATDCPGITSLGDTKALQLGEKRMYQALDKVVDPPLQGSATMKGILQGQSVRSGDIIYSPDANDPGLTSIYSNFRPDLNAIRSVNQETENRISKAFYEDLFLMLANSDRRQITAREVAEKHEEKLLMLGPVLERLHTELLDPLIDRTFNILQREGVLPPPPTELQNKDLSIEYVSVLAQAQRLANTGAIQQISAFTGELTAIWPEARFKIDPNQAINDYADALGVNPSMINSNDEANELLQAEQQAQQQAQMVAQGEQMLDMAKSASEIPMEGDNALTAAMDQAGMG